MDKHGLSLLFRGEGSSVTVKHYRTFRGKYNLHVVRQRKRKGTHKWHQGRLGGLTNSSTRQPTSCCFVAANVTLVMLAVRATSAILCSYPPWSMHQRWVAWVSCDRQQSLHRSSVARHTEGTREKSLVYASKLNARCIGEPYTVSDAVTWRARAHQRYSVSCWHVHQQMWLVCLAALLFFHYYGCCFLARYVWATYGK